MTPEGDSSSGDTPKPEDKKEESGKKKYKIAGEEVELSDDEHIALLELGAKTYLDSRKPKPEEDKKDDNKEESKTDVEKLTETVNNLKQQINNDNLTRRQEKVLAEIDDFANGDDLTKGDKELHRRIRLLVLAEAQSNPRINLKKTYEDHVNYFKNDLLKKRAKYVEEKVKDSDKVKDHRGSSTTTVKEEKRGGLFKGDVRKRVLEKVKSGRYN